jgi:quercetin dioxygenase-like cupin family protein
MGYTVVDLSRIEPGGAGGVVRFVRRELGATAFGLNHFTLPPNSEGHEHDETGTGQEEVMMVLGGSGTLRVDGEEIPLHPGRFVRLDPESRRLPVAGPDGLTFVTVGSPRETPYVARGPF